MAYICGSEILEGLAVATGDASASMDSSLLKKE
jgi:hypothetical protein